VDVQSRAIALLGEAVKPEGLEATRADFEARRREYEGAPPAAGTGSP
jgi:hypothetical protein